MIRDLLAKPLRDLTPNDLAQFIGSTEDNDLEFKGPLPWRDKGSEEPWTAGKGDLGDYTKREIVKEVIALANAGGGTLFVGIDEDPGNTGTASAIRPLPRVDDLAERLSRALDALVDPRLPQVEVRGIVTDSTSGVVAIRVGESWLRPHKHIYAGHCYVRRGKNAEPMSMREVRDMIYLGDKGAAEIDRRFAERSKLLNDSILGLTKTFGFRITGQPLVPLHLGRATKETARMMQTSERVARRGNLAVRWYCPMPVGMARPSLRAWERRSDIPDGDQGLIRVEDSGLIEYRWILRDSEIDPQSGSYLVFAGWLMSIVANCLDGIRAVRKAANSENTGYVVEIQLAPCDQFRLGADGDVWMGRTPVRYIAPEVVRYAVSDDESFATLCSTFEEELWNHVGMEHSAATLRIDPLRE